MRRLAPLLCLALVAAGCSDDDGAPAATGAEPPATAASADEPGVSGPDEPPATDEPADSAPATDDPVGDGDGGDGDAERPADDPPTSEAGTAIDPDEPPTSDGEPPVVTDGDPDDQLGGGFDDVFIADSQIDDVPICQSFAQLFNVFVGISFIGVFGQLDETFADEGVEVDVEADVPEVFAEILEVALYPSLLDDVDVLEAEGPSFLTDAFGPLYERVRAVPAILAEAGFSAEEIEALASAGDDVEDLAGSVDDTDERLTTAAELLVAQRGPFEQFAVELNTADATTDPEAEAAAEAFFEEACPLLTEFLDA